MPHKEKQLPEQAALSSGRWKLLFRNFFFFLLAAMSVAQWLVPVWIWKVIGTAQLFFPLLLHVFIPFVFFGLNLTLLRSMRRIIHLPAPVRISFRVYLAYGFTSVFCFVFLLFSSGLWAIGWTLSHAVGVATAASHETLVLMQAPLWQALRWLSSLGLGGIIVSFLYGYTWGQSTVRVSHLPLPLKNWPQEWHGLKIVHLSDLHIGPNLTKNELQAYVRTVNSLQPHLILLTGDILDSNPAYIPEFFPILAELNADFGMYACLGNHDHYAGAQAVIDGLHQYTQVELLRDQTTHIVKHNSQLHIIGLDDRGQDWARGLKEVPLLSELHARIPSHEPCILLSHRPDLFPQAARLGIPLTLSGHTHGGQFALPGWQGRFNLARFITHFSRGVYESVGSFLYVNRGLGVTGQRIRVFTPREIWEK
jgi:predicted MPP superfamily phosphohydrolase